MPINLRGTAFGNYHFVSGLGALPAGLLFGFLWHTCSAGAAFLTGAALAILAGILLQMSGSGYRISEGDSRAGKSDKNSTIRKAFRPPASDLRSRPASKGLPDTEMKLIGRKHAWLRGV